MTPFDGTQSSRKIPPPENNSTSASWRIASFLMTTSSVLLCWRSEARRSLKYYLENKHLPHRKYTAPLLQTPAGYHYAGKWPLIFLRIIRNTYIDTPCWIFFIFNIKPGGACANDYPVMGEEWGSVPVLITQRFLQAEMWCGEAALSIGSLHAGSSLY